MVDESGYSSKGLRRLFNGVLMGAAIGIAAYSADKINRVYAQQPPGLPIGYWDSPSGCPTCNPSRGVFRDGLLFVDGEAVELLMDCDGDVTRETNVNTSDFNSTLMGGAYDILVAEETSPRCGYSRTNASRQAGTARIGGLLAYPRNLLLTSPGASIQQRLDTYTDLLEFTDNSTLVWSPGTPEAAGYDVIRGGIPGLRSPGFNSMAVIQEACNIPSTTITGLTTNPSPDEIFFFLVRPRTASSLGSYGADSNGTDRGLPLAGDCPL
ncbi:MAG: hypothetical protein HY367_01915 [Candidatus Aenigmarchaeota archaeon]|nr:hypothetical protein [Candidatus Aenigmarchaeota archaeon]